MDVKNGTFCISVLYINILILNLNLTIFTKLFKEGTDTHFVPFLSKLKNFSK